MQHSIIVSEYGEPKVMKWSKTAVPSPKANEVLIKHTAIGLNYIDVYYRRGIYKADKLPFTPGMEAVGIIEEVGENVSFFAKGDRVAYGKPTLGAYSEYRTIDQDMIVKVPEQISDEHAVGAMVQGMAAHYLLYRTYMVKKDSTILVHAAAGSVGTVICQWAKLIGATVIGTVSTEEKAEWAKKNGCDHVIIYSKQDFVAEVKSITGGVGCNVVYDSVGKDTFLKSLDCVMPFGVMVSYGQSSGEPPAIKPSVLMDKGSIFLTRPSITHYKHDKQEYINSAAEIFTLIVNNALKIHVGQSYYLSDVARAHTELENRQTKGSSILIPDNNV